MPPCNVELSPALLKEGNGSSQKRKVTPLDRTAQNHNIETHKPHRVYDPVLKWLYLVLCYLCISMVFWILVSPASWLISRSAWHREVLIPFIRLKGGFRVIPEAVITKYQGHTLVHFTHIVPAAMWAAIVPWQLHPSWRHRHRKLHRILGYIFVMMVLPIAAGIGIIAQRKLTNAYDFPNDDLPPQNKLLDVGYPPALAVLACWFAGTAFYAAYLARTKRYQRHQYWMIRHVATGIFVAVQRFLFIPVAIAVLRFTHPPPDPLPAWLQRDIFGGTGNCAVVTAILLGEYAVYRMASAVKHDGKKSKAQ